MERLFLLSLVGAAIGLALSFFITYPLETLMWVGLAVGILVGLFAVGSGIVVAHEKMSATEVYQFVKRNYCPTVELKDEKAPRS
jgi:hypothetical protein